MNTRHYSEDELILHHYGEDGRARSDIARHLEHCERCHTAYRQLADTLALVAAPEAPERGEQYGLEVWQRIRHQLPDREPAWWSFAEWFGHQRLAAGLAMVTLIVAAFVAGRLWPRETPARLASTTQPTPAPAQPSNTVDTARERILLSAVADHLERSERVLTDLMNVQGRDISAEQSWADDLLAGSRIYRQDAEDIGEPLVADTLDELERSLLEIVHSPSRISPAALEQLRYRIDAASLLFKVRVLGDELRRRNEPPAERATPAAFAPTTQS